MLAHWNNSPRADLSLYSDILFWFRPNQSLLLKLYVYFISELHVIYQILRMLIIFENLSSILTGKLAIDFPPIWELAHL
jgi:hypothetical protein